MFCGMFHLPFIIIIAYCCITVVDVGTALNLPPWDQYLELAFLELIFSQVIGNWGPPDKHPTIQII